MSGWDDAGELALEGIDKAVDKYYDWTYDGVQNNIHKVKKLRKKDTPNSKSGRDQDSEAKEADQPQDQPQDQRSRDISDSSPKRTASIPPQQQQQAYQDANPYGGGATRSRGFNSMGDNGYGPSGSTYEKRSAYDDGYDNDGADAYRERYKPTRPSGPYSPQPYDPSRYAPAAAAGAAAGAAYAANPRGSSEQQRYLPPPPRAYDDPYDDGYDSYDDDRDRRRSVARRSKSDSRLGSRSRRGSSAGGSHRDRGYGDEDDGEFHRHGPQHLKMATIGGAVAGGLIGHSISSRRGKPETFTSVAGAIIGAVAAREIDKWYETRKEDRKEKEFNEHEEHEREKHDRDDGGRYQF